MSFHIYLGASLEELADGWIEAMEKGRRQRGPFAKATVIVPNPGMRRWMQLRMADRLGIAAQMDFDFLDRGLMHLSQSLPGAPNRNEKFRGLISSQHLQFKIFALLQTQDFKKWHPAGEEGVHSSAQKTLSLWRRASKLAKLFFEYERQRPDMLLQALEGGALRYQLWGHSEGDEPAEMQFSLLSALARMDSENSTHETMMIFQIRELGRRCARDSDSTKAMPIHIFAPSPLGAGYLEMMKWISISEDIRLYILNVCQEFWEDEKTESEKRWQKLTPSSWHSLREKPLEQREEGEVLGVREQENRLLGLWGKPGREMLRLLSDMQDQREMDMELHICQQREKKVPQSVLETLQDMVSRRTDVALKRISQDDSFQMGAAPNRVREVESVWNSIFDFMCRDSELRADEIAILAPDIQIYLPVIRFVFEKMRREVAPIDWVGEEIFVGHRSHAIKGFLSLLDLLDNSVTRRSVLELLENSCIQSGLGLSSQEVELMARWTRELGIFHHLDESHRVRDRCSTGDRYTWEGGLRRLRMSRVFGVDENAGFGHWGVDEDHEEALCALEGLTFLIKALIQFSERARCATTAREWHDLLGDMLDDLMQAPPEEPLELEMLSEIRKALQDLEQLHLELMGAGAEQVCTLDLVRSYMKGRLVELKRDSQHYLTGGVNVSSLRPMRPIPFKVVYILGLGEGAFPGTCHPDAMDLRTRRRRIGDITPPESNRYLFLELLCSVKKHLSLSYVNRDLQKEEWLEPCSTINELYRYLNEVVLKQGATFVIQKISLSTGPLESGPQESARIIGNLLLNHDKRGHLLHYLDQCWQRQEEPTSEEALSQAEHYRSVLWKSQGVASMKSPVTALDMESLADYLCNPGAAYAKWALGWRHEPSLRHRLVEDEPVVTEHHVLSDWHDRLLQTLQEEVSFLDDASKGEAWILENYERESFRARGPEGDFAMLDREKIMSQMRSRLQSPALKKWRKEREADVWHPNLALELEFEVEDPGHRPRTVEISGKWQNLWLSTDKNRVRAARSSNTPETWLREWLKFLCFCASASPPFKSDAELHLYLWDENYSGGDGFEVLEFHAIPGEEAIQYLQELVREFLFYPKTFHLPFEIIAKDLTDKKYSGPEMKLPLRQWMIKAEQYRESPSPGQAWVRLLPNEIPQGLEDWIIRRYAMPIRSISKNQPS